MPGLEVNANPLTQITLSIKSRSGLLHIGVGEELACWGTMHEVRVARSEDAPVAEKLEFFGQGQEKVLDFGCWKDKCW